MIFALERPDVKSVPVIFTSWSVQRVRRGGKHMTRRLSWHEALAIGRHDQLEARDFKEALEKKWRIENRDGHCWLSKPTMWQNIQVGDELWVKEACVVHAMAGIKQLFGYVADNYSVTERFEILRHAHQCARWASRITLKVTSVKTEPLQAISREDAIAEGVERIEDPRGEAWKSYETYADGSPHMHAVVPVAKPETAFRELWQSLHGKKSWKDNPDVVAIGFERIR